MWRFLLSIFLSQLWHCQTPWWLGLSATRYSSSTSVSTVFSSVFINIMKSIYVTKFCHKYVTLLVVMMFLTLVNTSRYIIGCWFLRRKQGHSDKEPLSLCSPDVLSSGISLFMSLQSICTETSEYNYLYTLVSGHQVVIVYLMAGMMSWHFIAEEEEEERRTVSWRC